jgi:hypothetical protein
MALSLLDQSRQELVAAMHCPDGDRPMLGRLVIVAPRREAAALRKRVFQLLDDLQREFGAQDDARPSAGDERWAFTMTFTPLLGGKAADRHTRRRRARDR